VFNVVARTGRPVMAMPFRVPKLMTVAARPRSKASRPRTAAREAILAAMLDEAAQGIAMFDRDHRLIGWNEPLRQLLGLTEAFLDGAPSYADFVGHLERRGDFGPPSPGLDASLRELLATPLTPRQDERMLPDGRILACRRSVPPAGGLMLVYADVSAERHGAYLAEDSERRLRTILEKAPAALAVIGQEDGGIKHVNARFRRMFGLGGGPLPQEADIAQYVADEDRARILGAATSAHTDFETAVRRSDGAEFWALVGAIRFVFEWEPAILASFYDITDRRQAEAGFRRELARRQAELGEARVLQHELVPEGASGAIGRFTFAVDVVLEPANEVGGDLVDFFFVGDNLVVVLGDVSHKGAAAALFMARTHSLVRGIAARPDAAAMFDDPAAAVDLVNAALARNNAMCMFVTLLVASFNTDSGRLAYVRAGHVPPFVHRATGGIERLHEAGGPPLGLIEDASFRTAAVTLSPGDRLLAVTDGITEAADPSGAQFGETRLGAAFAAIASADTGALGRLTAAVRVFEAGTPPADDVAAILLTLGESPGKTEPG
jgi:phosphoserine phosphatase RsbU/P